MDKLEYSFTYDEPKNLRALVLFLENHKMELSVFLRAEAPNALHILHDFYVREREQISRTKEQEALYLVGIHALVKAGDQHRILPFYDVCYDEGVYPHGDYVHPGLGEEYERLFVSSMAAERLVQGFRPYSIHFKDAKKQHVVEQVQKSVAKLTENDYWIHSLKAGLNPRYPGEYTDYGASLHARDGTIYVYVEGEKEKRELKKPLLELMAMIGAKQS